MSKFPYVNCTEKELKHMESYSFAIEMGGDFLLHDGYTSFTKSESVKIYRSTLRDLISVVRDGCEKDKNYALQLIGTLKVLPMRMH
jgi:hypothetical protein